MEKTFNTEPKNELEVRLVCVDMAMQIVMNGNIDKTDTILDSAEKLFKFVTKDGVLEVQGIQDVLDTVKPFIETLTRCINDHETHEVVEHTVPEVVVPEVVVPEVPIVAVESTEEIPKVTKTKK